MDTEQQIRHDLGLSGLGPSDIRARPIDMTERAACGVPPQVEGYVIPYFNIAGKPLGFYRVKLFGHELKYKQLKNTSNHVYFPPNFMEVYKKHKTPYIIITEGEKKAAAACKAGFPCIAFGGVDSWRNRILLLPKDTEFSAYSYNKALVGAKLPSSGWDLEGIVADNVAVGFEELANFLRDNKLHAIIIYDSDETTAATGMKVEVQRAATELGFELRRRGLPIYQTRQLILPIIDNLGKTGLDDFLNVLEDGPERLTVLLTAIMKKRSAFPVHPNMEADLNKKLQNAKITRKDIQRLALSLITDLDARGIRMYASGEQRLYYFEEKTNRLTRVELGNSTDGVQVTPFGKLLYKYYGLSIASDIRLIKWLMTQFAAEEPVADVAPHRIMTKQDPTANELCIQIGDGHYARVTGDPNTPLEIHHNGSNNILFEAGQVEPINPDELIAEFNKRKTEKLEMWWEDVLHEVRLKNHGKTATLFSLLYYISPWLHRWKGTQLPAELIIGEAGSGKSTLLELRLSILTGTANLRNAPSDMKDWHASIANTGGLHATDNVQLVDKSLKQRLSDEICRLITEPNPHIEMRKYYTEADLIRLPVNSVFAFTAITQPFTASDILQRSVILELDKLSSEASTQTTDGKISYNSAWKQLQIERFGGRAAWMSHHLYVLHKFFELVSKKWDGSYQAKHRLINLEQCLMTMAELFGIESKWIPDYLMGQTDESVVEADWCLEGIRAFAETIRGANAAKRAEIAVMIGATTNYAQQGRFDAKTMATWFCQHDDFMECLNLTNPRKLGRYLQTHKAMIQQVCGVREGIKINNRLQYVVDGPKDSG